MGTLYLVGTPIGNLEDITLRALRVLREVPLIAAEDTRRTRILLDHYGITTPMTSYFEHSGAAKLAFLLRHLESQDLALVSEAGMPGISDPGYDLVRAAIERGLPVVPVPGPSAIITALAAAGLPTDQFLYLGFLPRRAGERRRRLEEVRDQPRTIVAFEAPHRLRATLADMLAVFGPDRPLVIARELTKLHEEFLRGTVGSLARLFQERRPQGEFTLVIGGAPPRAPTEEAVRTALRQALARGLSPREAVEAVVQATGARRREVYRLLLAERGCGKI